MAKNSIPPEIRRFILTSISSVPHIEALMLLRTNAPTQWIPSTLAKRLYVTTDVAKSVLSDLCNGGMLKCNAEKSLYYFDPDAIELSDLITRLAEIYSTQLVEVTLLIHSTIDRKAQQFANAFTFRRDA